MTDREEIVLPTYFVWHIPDRGYQWVKAKSSDAVESQTDSPVMLFLTEHPQNTTAHAYVPFEAEEPSSLSFVDFAQLSGPGEIVAFANRYGWLGIAEPIVSTAGQVFSGEGLAQWMKEIRAMRLLLQLDEALRIRDEGRREKLLQTFLTWTADQTNVSLHWRDGHFVQTESISAAKAERQLRSLLKRGQCTGPALRYLTTELNRKLAEMVAPCVLLNRKGDFTGHLRPRHLLGALWLQFYRARLGTMPLRACRHCGTWMNVAQRTARKRFCDTCVNKRRTYSFRWNEAVAKITQKLARKGLSVEQRKRLIAKRATWQKKLAELDTDSES